MIAPTTRTRAQAASAPKPAGIVEVIDERLSSLQGIVGSVDSVSAAGLGWSLLDDWEQQARRRFDPVMGRQAVEELARDLRTRRESQIVLGDPYGNFLRVTDSYLEYLVTLRARFQ